MKANMRMFVSLTVALLAGVALAVFAQGGVSLQAELDVSADKEGCGFIHADDWRSWVNHWKARGCTDEMFVSAFSKVCARTLDAEYLTAKEYKCLKAMSGIGEFKASVSNLTTVIQVVKNAKSPRLRSAAVHTFYGQTKGTDAFLDFAEDVLLSTNLQTEVEAFVMSGLWHDARENQHKKGSWPARAANLMRRYVERDVRGLDGADQILKWTDPAYADSPLRRDIRKRILAPEFKEVIDRYRGRADAGLLIQQQYRREEEEENSK